MKISELNRLYDEADDRCRELFAEMRSNILLVSGNHYARRNSKFIRTVRGAETLSNQQKLRLTKNHVQKIIKGYINNILTLAPGTGVTPRNQSEMQDIKAADLHSSIWSWLKQQHNINVLYRDLIKDYMEIGELWCKIFHDPDQGKFLGYRKETEEEEENKGKDPEFQGALVYERHQGFNVLVDPEARSYQEARFVIFRKMLPIKDLKEKYKGDEEKLGWIGKSSKETYKVFDSLAGQYSDVKGLTMVREHFYRPCPEYPMGYFYITTEQGILHEGELPFGIWPIVHKGFDEVSTSPRSYSLIKQLRPYQAEINRTASKIGETQITLGDAKIITAPGASLSPGATMHGIRHIKATGAVLNVVPGSTGGEYLDYLNSQISEMYQIANFPDDETQKDAAGIDPWAMLFRSMREKKKFSPYAQKIGEAFCDLTEISLELTRKYIKDDELIPVIGKTEFVNIDEFKNSIKLMYQIKVEEQSDDVETKIGRTLAMNHTMQYIGPTMTQEDHGLLIRHMPYMNNIKPFERFTMNEDIVESIILALDRGKYPELRKRSPHDFIAKRLEHRMSRNDFDFLSDEIKANYEKCLKEHETELAEQQKQAQMAEDGNIPTGGYLVTCDFYVPNPAGPDKPPKRVRIPSQALEQVLKKLEAQGQSQDRLQQEPLSVQADVGAMMGQSPQGQGEAPPDQAAITRAAQQ